MGAISIAIALSMPVNDAIARQWDAAEWRKANLANFAAVAFATLLAAVVYGGAVWLGDLVQRRPAHPRRIVRGALAAAGVMLLLAGGAAVLWAIQRPVM